MSSYVQRLRDLAWRVREIAELPVQKSKILQWQALNDLSMKKPMVYVRDYDWDMVAPKEIRVKQGNDSFERRLELQLNRILFEWEHMPVDRVVQPVIRCYAEVENEHPIEYTIRTNNGSSMITTSQRSMDSKLAHSYERRIFDEKDVERILPMPRISYDEDRFNQEYEIACEIFEGVLDVIKTGITHIECTPWDDILKLFSIEEGFVLLHENPTLMHKAVERYLSVYIEMLSQFEQMGLLHQNSGNHLIGSGGLGYTSAMCSSEAIGTKANQCWGFCTDQIFTSVSESFFDQYAIAHEKKWMDRFAMTYYGCCERLDQKIDMLRSFKNLRKISISPYSDPQRALSQIGSDYVVSFKPNSNWLAYDHWDREASKNELIQICRLSEKYDCAIEIVMKTMISLHGQPERLFEWCKMASEITAAYG